MKKYLSFLLLLGLLYACSGDSPEVPAPKPEPDTDQDDNKDPKPDLESGTTYVFPKDFSDALVGKEVTIKNEMVVVRTFGDKLDGKITLAPSMLRIPTDIQLPGTDAYKEQEKANRDAKLTLEPQGISLLDPAIKTLRVGTKFSGLKGKVSKDRDRFMLILSETPTIEYAKRTTFADANKNVSDAANVTVATMNLEYYMASPSSWGHSNGAHDKAAFERQHTKIVAAMKEMKADIFAVCEIEEGDYSPAFLTKELNKALGTTVYKFVDTGDKKVSSYTKNTFIYNAEVVNPFKDCKSYDADYLKLRHIIQCFELNGSGEKFILSLNHYKSKSGKASGLYVDKHDGQGAFNARRVEEAKNCLKTFASLQDYYGDKDIMVVGDLNSYSKEDPIRLFTDAGYVDELMKYDPSSWSYIYDGQAGYLDHILSSATMTTQVLDAFSWDVNASEPSGVGYKNEYSTSILPYRYSDHNPVIAVLGLK